MAIFDTDYKLNHAYDLIQSRLLQADEGLLDFSSRVIHAKYFPNWLRLAQAFYSEYNPIENYSMEEERTPNLTTTEVGNEQASKDNSLVNTGTTKNIGTIKNDSSSQSTANNSENTSNTHLVSPFNSSSEYVNNDKMISLLVMIIPLIIQVQQLKRMIQRKRMTIQPQKRKATTLILIEL